MLDSIHSETFERFLSIATRTSVRVGDELFHAGESASHVHFLTKGVASVIAQGPDGRSCEVAIYGDRSAPGAISLLGQAPSITSCCMLTDGTAWTLTSANARMLFDEHPDFQRALLLFIRDHTRLLELFASCSGTHSVRERLARWLLCFATLQRSLRIGITHDRLSQLLGARRPTISIAVAELERLGRVKQQRAGIAILDFDGLRAESCPCFPLWRQIYLDRRKKPNEAQA